MHFENACRRPYLLLHTIETVLINQGNLNKSNCKRDSKITAHKQSYIYVKPSEKVVMPVMLSLTRFSVQIISSQILTEE